MASVVEIWRSPVKSMAGERLDSCAVGEMGLEGDRRWAFVDDSPNRAGKLFTIREDERLMTYAARLAGGHVEVVTSGGEVRDLDAQMVAELAAEASRPLSLREVEGANFDDSPVLVVNLATVAEFGVQAGMHVDHRRFRAQIDVAALAPGGGVASGGEGGEGGKRGAGRGPPRGSTPGHTRAPGSAA